MLNRRSFLTYFSLGWLTTCFPVVLAACAPKAEIQSTTDANASTNDQVAAKPVSKKTADGFTIVGTVAELEKNGFIQTKEFAVAKNPTNPKQLVAVNPKCTHKGCDVAWLAESKKYECPCHSAQFAVDGKVLAGPADRNLTTYAAKVVGTQVLVKI